MSSNNAAAGPPCAGQRVEQLVQLRLDRRTTRRGFLRCATAAGATLASAPSCESTGLAQLLTHHYKELTNEDKRRIFRRLEQQTEAKTGVKVKITDPPPLQGMHYAYGLNLSHCIGCRRCAEACARENNLPNDPEMRYIRVLELPDGTQELGNGTVDYDPEYVPQPGKYYLPVQCHQCKNPPCVKACPTGATWQEPDGITVIDYDWCIGCRYCQAACPYYARRFNWVEPQVEPHRINPDQGYLSNRMRPVGVVEKCTFCLHRVRRGRYPACYEACPTGARKFGNLADPKSEVRRIFQERRIWILKEELGTEPRFFYFYGK